MMEQQKIYARQLDPEARARLAIKCRERYESGEILREIAASIGVSKSFVGYLVMEAGGTMRLGGNRNCRNIDLPAKQKLGAWLKQQYESGVRVADLATPNIGNEPYVRRLLRWAGTEMRPSGNRPDPVKRNAQRREFRARYESGEDLKTIASSVGLSHATVAIIIRQAGGIIRRKGFRAPHPKEPT